jgi:putative tricarboxylic transport membrane protein
MHIRAPKDFWSGIMFIAFAAVALIASHSYSLGRAGRMGPGYFPLLLGCALVLIGLILVARSLFTAGERIEPMQLLPLGIIAAGIVVFGLLLQPLGLVLALLAVIVITAFASGESRPLETAALAVVLTAFSVGIFVVALRLPLPIWPAFL